jgi:hypothetical protein
MRAYFINTHKRIWYQEIAKPLPRVIQVLKEDPRQICKRDQAEKLETTDFYLGTVTDIAVYWEKVW